MEERVGFEPTVYFYTRVFKTPAINHSAISPNNPSVKMDVININILYV